MINRSIIAGIAIIGINAIIMITLLWPVDRLPQICILCWRPPTQTDRSCNPQHMESAEAKSPQNEAF